MAAKTLHVVFTPAAAERLGEALQAEGRKDQVVACPDDFSFGPINPDDPNIRRKWMAAEIGYSDWMGAIVKANAFFRSADASDRRCVAWMSRRSVAEFANFLVWLWHRGSAAVEIVDLTDEMVPGFGSNGRDLPLRPAISLAGMSGEQIVDARLLDRAEPLSALTCGRYHKLWRQLRAENAPLRILNGDELASAPITHFDEPLRSHVVKNWRKVARVVGEVLAKLCDEPFDPVNDIFLAARVRAMANAGLLESQGNLTRMRYSEVRLPR
jgi:hypothetical protein